MEAKKNFLEDLLPQLRQILEKLGFKGCSPRSPYIGEAMKGVVEVNDQIVPEVHNPHNHLTQELEKDNAE